MALATIQLVAIPLLAGLVAGTGAVATYVKAPEDALASTASASRPCSAQTWPYIDRACVSDAQQEPRTVRIVTPLRPEDAFAARWAAAPPPNAAPALPGMTTSDGVLRQPQNVDAIPDAPVAAPPPRTKRSEAKPDKRKRPEQRVVSQSYQVPAERNGATREVTVVRPLRLDFLR